MNASGEAVRGRGFAARKFLVGEREIWRLAARPLTHPASYAGYHSAVAFENFGAFIDTASLIENTERPLSSASYDTSEF